MLYVTRYTLNIPLERSDQRAHRVKCPDQENVNIISHYHYYYSHTEFSFYQF